MLEYFEKHYFLNPLSKGRLIKGWTLINLIENFEGKQNINFSKTLLILNSVFYIELKVYSFVGLFRKPLVFQPPLKSAIDTKGVPLST